MVSGSINPRLETTELDSFEVATGTWLGGDVADLLFSDKSYLQTRLNLARR